MARPRSPLSGVRRAGAVVVAMVVCLSGCDGALVNLGNSTPLVVGGDAGAGGSAVAGSGAQGGSGGAREWSNPEVVLIADLQGLANPALPADRSQLLFTRLARGEVAPHIWEAVLVGDDGFGIPDFERGKALALGEDPDTGESTPALSADGEELWFGKDTPGSNTDVYLARREGTGWGTPAPVSELSSEAHDSPRPLGLYGTVMPLSSTRQDGKLFQIYLATREQIGAPWGAPNQDHLANINVAGASTVDGFLSDDGLTLYYAFAPADPNKADLFRARRSAADQPFDVPEPLYELQRASDERDPWLSPDGWLYFSSNRSGMHAIYRARHLTP